MKFDHETRLYSARLGALAAAAACALVLMLMAADPASAQDAAIDTSASGSLGRTDRVEGTAGSSWERTDSVLEVPPVYRSASVDQPDTCAEDCPNSGDPAKGSIAVFGTADNASVPSAGTADDPTTQSAAVNGSSPQDASVEQSAGNGIDNQGLDNENPSVANAGQDGLDPTVGTAQEYREQQASAERLGNPGMVQIAPVFIPVPVSPYHSPGYLPGSVGSAPGLPRPIGAPSVLMPPPMPRLAPLPPIVPRGFPQGPAGLPGSATAGAGVGVAPGSAPMTGFHGAFGGFHGGFGHR